MFVKGEMIAFYRMKKRRVVRIATVCEDLIQLMTLIVVGEQNCSRQKLSENASGRPDVHFGAIPRCTEN